MSRLPINVLIIPFYIKDSIIKYALFKRVDMECWQGIAGGVEENETPLQAAKRECWEEAQIDRNSNFIQLDSMTTIPAVYFDQWKLWDEETYVVKEISFGVEVATVDFELSAEHNEYGWFKYSKAMDLLIWDSNKTALWELNKRLEKNKTLCTTSSQT